MIVPVVLRVPGSSSSNGGSSSSSSNHSIRVTHALDICIGMWHTCSLMVRFIPYRPITGLSFVSVVGSRSRISCPVNRRLNGTHRPSMILQVPK